MSLFDKEKNTENTENFENFEILSPKLVDKAYVRELIELINQIFSNIVYINHIYKSQGRLFIGCVFITSMLLSCLRDVYISSI